MPNRKQKKHSSETDDDIFLMIWYNRRTTSPGRGRNIGVNQGIGESHPNREHVLKTTKTKKKEPSKKYFEGGFQFASSRRACPCIMGLPNLPYLSSQLWPWCGSHHPSSNNFPVWGSTSRRFLGKSSGKRGGNASRRTGAAGQQEGRVPAWHRVHTSGVHDPRAGPTAAPVSMDRIAVRPLFFFPTFFLWFRSYRLFGLIRGMKLGQTQSNPCCLSM